MYESVCYVITLRCDLSCKHCFVSCGPNVNYTVCYEKINKMVMNSARFCYRVWISGGEATLYPDVIDAIVVNCKKSKKVYGYPEEICLQTNANWGKDDLYMEQRLEHYKNIGITDIDISSNDIYHFEQMGSNLLPQKVAEAAKKYGFKSVTLAGAPTKNLKLLGRAKQLKLRESTEDNNCTCFDNNFLVYPNGDVYNCKWAVTKPFGNIFDDNLQNLINAPKASFARILFKQGPEGLIRKLNEKGVYLSRTETDICDFCKRVTDVYCEMNQST